MSTKLNFQHEKSPEKTSSNPQPESPGIICATPPLRKKKKSIKPACETSPSLLQHSRGRRKKIVQKSPLPEKIGISCGLLLESSQNDSLDCFIPPTKFNKSEFIAPSSPIVLSKKSSKNELSPVVCKMKKSKFEDSVIIDEVFTCVGVELPVVNKINRALFASPSEKIEENASQSMEKKLPEIKSTQIIDEFDTCAISLISQKKAYNGWKPEEKISAILSAERARRSLCCEQNGSETEIRKRKNVSLSPLELYLNALESYKVKRGLEDGCEKNSRIDGWKDFHVLDVFEGVPLMVRASGEEGLVFIVLTEDLLKNQNAFEPGCILRIYPPWLMINDEEQSEVFYTSVSGCDVRCVEGRCLEEKVDLREIASEPFLDPAFLMRALLGDD